MDRTTTVTFQIPYMCSVALPFKGTLHTLSCCKNKNIVVWDCDVVSCSEPDTCQQETCRFSKNPTGTCNKDRRHPGDNKHLSCTTTAVAQSEQCPAVTGVCFMWQNGRNVKQTSHCLSELGFRLRGALLPCRHMSLYSVAL